MSRPAWTRDDERRDRLRVAVADSLPLIDAALRALVASLPGIDAVPADASVSAGRRAGTQGTDALAGSPDPDVMVLLCPDPRALPALSGKGPPGIPVVLLAARWTGEQAAAALEAGARGCLSGSTTAEGLAAALRQVGRGEVALSPEVTQAILTGLGRARRSNGGPPLSPREREVLAFVCAGLGNKEIAQRLYLSLRTVENHLAAVYAKLGVGSRTEAAVLAVRTGLVDAPEPRRA